MTEATIVIVAHPDREAIRAGRKADTCSATAGRSTDSSSFTAAPGRGSQSTTRPSRGATAHGVPHRHGVRGARFKLPLDDPRDLTLALLVLLAVGAGLVGLSALPVRRSASSSVVDVFARNRFVVAALGVELLAVAALAYAFF